MKYFYLYLIPLMAAFYFGCPAASEAKGDQPAVPACVFEREPVAIFCMDVVSCFVCYKSNGNTECWPFERQRCYH